jgi:hypothetical protein
MHRGDSDAGGAADLQTDIMRFMAILALCLVAIFALVQSIPLIPEAPAESTEAAAPPPQTIPKEPEPESITAVVATPVEAPPEQAVQLTRPKWKSTFITQQSAVSPKAVQAQEPDEEPAPTAAPPAQPASRGFTLRFESDHALTRLVAAGKISLYAIGDGHSRRMTVSESRISFWDASTPNAFHEMETSTVPQAVVDALARSGISKSGIDWGVTLPGKLKQQLDSLMREHTGGALVIGLDGNLRLEPS